VNLKKKEIIAVISLIIMILLFCLIILFVYFNKNKDSSLIEEKPLQNDKSVYVKEEVIENEEYSKVYKFVNVKRIKFMNISDDVVSDFYKKQDEIINVINSNIDSNKEFIDKYNLDNNINNYVNNSTLDSIVLYDIKNNILSVLFLVEDTIDYKGLTNSIINIFIDVKNNKVLDNDEILTIYNLDKKVIVDNVIENVLNSLEEIVDSDTNGVIKKETIIENIDVYSERLMDNFDSYIYMYFNDNNLYLKYNRNEISNFLFNEDLEIGKYSTLKI